jgi:Uma2 family endonuclease
MPVSLKRKPISAEAYHLMIDAGILTEDDKVELLNGDIVLMSPVGPRHASHVKLLRVLLGNIYREKAVIGVQDPVDLGDFDQPEPDISVLVPSKDFYLKRHPTANEIQLLIEVSDSTLERDRAFKLPIYAKAGIPFFWIVNLIDKKVECYANPHETS